MYLHLHVNSNKWVLYCRLDMGLEFCCHIHASRRIKGNRGREAESKKTVWGLFKCNRKVYTEIISEYKRHTSSQIIRENAEIENAIHGDNQFSKGNGRTIWSRVQGFSIYQRISGRSWKYDFTKAPAARWHHRVFLALLAHHGNGSKAVCARGGVLAR